MNLFQATLKADCALRHHNIIELGMPAISLFHRKWPVSRGTVRSEDSFVVHA